MKFNIEVEAECLGAILNNSNLMCDAIALEPKDFYKDRHQIIFSYMKQMFKDGDTIEITTLANKLNNELSAVGGITYLSELFSSSLTRDIKPYTKIIKEKSEIRSLHIELQKAINQIEEGRNLEEVIGFLQERTLSSCIGREESCDMEPILNEFLYNLENRFKSGGEVPGIKTHIDKLNFLLGGLKKQEYIIVAARPSMGKSVFATNLCAHIALKEKKHVVLFNLEMSKEAIIKRMVSNLAGIEGNKIRDGRLNDKEWEDIVKAASNLNCSYLGLYDSIISIDEIYSTCKKLKIQNKLDIAIIDYLGLIDGLDKENRNQEVSKISRKLKMMAKELDITIIALSQLSRASETRSDHRPVLSDLRESGSIEQDADAVMFLYRDSYYRAESTELDKVEIIVAKQRDGRLAAIKCKWMPEFQRICSLCGG
jgi:replicative DNA helicase